MEKWENNYHFWAFSRGGTGTKQSGTGTIIVLSTGTGTKFSVPVPNALFWTSVKILTITSYCLSDLSDSSSWLN